MLAGPSGVGKGTIVNRLVEADPNLWVSVSATTRPPREGERDGVDYHFLSREDFEALRAGGGFLEAFEVFGHLYGTPRRSVEDRLAAGDDVVLEIDVQGALAVRRVFPDSLLVFVRPPSRDEQERRLLARGRDSDDVIRARLDTAEAEEREAALFDEVVVNDDLDTAVGRIAAILAARRQGV